VTQEDLDHVAVALQVTGILDRLNIRHTIGGSIAASFAGEPRSTIDIDFVVGLAHEDVAALVAALEPAFYVSADALHRAIDIRGTANVIHQDSQVKVDIFIAGGTPLDEQQLARRLRVEVRPGQFIYVHPPEDILLQKLRWFRKGGGTSDRQWRDILAIIRTQSDRLDRAYLDLNAKRIDVTLDLDRAIAESAD
jgi:hypothetical protein